MMTRITSYNVCYTKLLRKFADRWKVAVARRHVDPDEEDVETIQHHGADDRQSAEEQFGRMHPDTFPFEQKIGVITSYSIHYTKLYDTPLLGTGAVWLPLIWKILTRP